jgi:hypothetical protein
MSGLLEQTDQGWAIVWPTNPSLVIVRSGDRLLGTGKLGYIFPSEATMGKCSENLVPRIKRLLPVAPTYSGDFK